MVAVIRLPEALSDLGEQASMLSTDMDSRLRGNVTQNNVNNG
jgi:hypothetical protein